jgi:hypothetical protein
MQAKHDRNTAALATLRIVVAYSSFSSVSTRHLERTSLCMADSNSESGVSWLKPPIPG